MICAILSMKIYKNWQILFMVLLAFPTGNAFNMVLLKFYLYSFLLPPRFPDDNFWTARRIIPKFLTVISHGQRKKLSLSDPARPPGGVWRAPKHPKISHPQKLCSEKKLRDIFRPSPPPSEHSPQSLCNNNPTITVQCEIPPTHIINTQYKQIMPLFRWSGLSLNVHTISNPRTQC